MGNRGYSSLQCVGFSLLWLLLWQSTGSRHTGSVVVVHGLSCSATCGIFPDQGSNPCPLHWQADSYPLCHQGSLTFLTLLSASAELELNLLATLNSCCSLSACTLSHLLPLSISISVFDRLTPLPWVRHSSPAFLPLSLS